MKPGIAPSVFLLAALVGCGRPSPQFGPPFTATAVKLHKFTVEIDLPPSMVQKSGQQPDSWDANWSQQTKDNDWPSGVGVSLGVPAPTMAPKSLEEAIDKSCTRPLSGKVLSKSEEAGGFQLVCLDSNSHVQFFRWQPLPEGFWLECSASMVGSDDAGGPGVVAPKLERICRTARLKP